MAATRRRFVGLLGASASLTAAGAALSRPAVGDPGTTASIRQQFDFTEDRVPMNAANLCPSPRGVAEAVTRYTQVIDQDPSFQNRGQFAEHLERSRALVAEGLNVSVDEIALVRNTSEANNIINNGLDLKRGDEVLLWTQNHPTNNVAWDVRAARFGLRVKRVDVPAQPNSVDELLEPFRAALTRRTRILTVTHISNVSGLKLPLVELAELCRSRGVHFHVDGAQSWGAVAMDLAAIGCDSFSGALCQVRCR